MQIKTKMQYHFTLTRWAKFKSQRIVSAGQVEEQQKLWSSASWDINLCNFFGKHVDIICASPIAQQFHSYIHTLNKLLLIHSK